MLCTVALTKGGEGLKPSLHSAHKAKSSPRQPQCPGASQNYCVCPTRRTPDSNLQEGFLQASRGPGTGLVPLPTHCELRDSLPVWLKLIITYPLWGCSLRGRLRVCWGGEVIRHTVVTVCLMFFQALVFGIRRKELLLVVRLPSEVTIQGDLRMCTTLKRSYCIYFMA